jgi:hypothetical protein
VVVALVEGIYSLPSRDKIGDDHAWVSAELMELSICRVKLCGLYWGVSVTPPAR